MTTTEPVEVDETTVTLTIDGVEVKAQKGELLITAAQKAGIFIPRFCYHDRLKPVGMCRMCLVEIEGVRGLPPACTTEVAEGMNVSFKKDNVEKAQDGVLEFLLINHPLDCPVCDRGGECPLQDQTLSFGPGESRFTEEKRHWEKPIEISDHVLLDRERCIQCSRCTRFADDVAGDPLITFVERGGSTEVNTFPGDPFASYFSGNIVQICPVGALTAKPYRFNSRPWDLQGAETTCQGCSVGCKGQAQTSRNEMVRFLGIDSEPINQGWLCDKGRYGFDFAHSENRVRKPFVVEDEKQVEVSISKAISKTAQAIKEAKENHGADSIAFIGGANGTNEDAYSLARLAKGIIGTSKVDSRVRNSISADIILSAKRARIADVDNADVVVTIGVDLKESLPVLYLRLRNAITQNSVSLVEANSVKTSLSSFASKNIDLIPGNENFNLAEIKDAIAQNRRSGNGKVVVIAGDVNPAQRVASFEELLINILEYESTYLLPAVSTSNAIGAYELGLAPGMLPGRVADDSADLLPNWPLTPNSVCQQDHCDTRSILKSATKGEIKVLILSGANLFDKFADTDLLKRAFANIETIIAFDCFINNTTKYADIFIPVTVANEKNGTVTNIESRVQRVVQVVAPNGVLIDEYQLAAQIGEELGVENTYEDVDDVTNEIARVASSFAHLTTGVLLRSRDGAIVPVDENKDVLSASETINVDTPSWEPIASQAHSDEDPLLELDREEHHPSANIQTAEMISKPLSREKAHSHHLDQYAMRLIFVDSFHRASPKTQNSQALDFVTQSRISNTVRVNPKDLDAINVKESNLAVFRNDAGTVKLRVIPDKNVMRGVIVAQAHPEHPLYELVDTNHDITDVSIEAGA